MVRLQAEFGQQRPAILWGLAGHLRGERLKKRHRACRSCAVEERSCLVYLAHADPGPE
jgi:hypothetical protein